MWMLGFAQHDKKEECASLRHDREKRRRFAQHDKKRVVPSTFLCHFNLYSFELVLG